MPSSTITYPFEYKVFAWMNSLSEWASPGDPQTFIITLNAEGALRTLTFESSSESWHQRIELFKQQRTPFIFFDPFDFPEYAWFEWYEVNQATLERLTDTVFEASDFINSRDQRRIDYPHTWGVMY